MPRFEPNLHFRHELRSSAEFTTGMQRITVALTQQIKLAAEPFRNTGYFVSHVRVGRRRVLLRDPFAHISEFGSVNNPPQGNVRRGVKAAGLRFRDGARNTD